MLEEITSGVHGFAEREFEDWAPVQLIATADKPLELLWANEYSVFLPQTLAIVDRAALDAHNAEMERLQAEVEALQQEREPAPPTMRERLDDCNAEVARLQSLPVWEPVKVNAVVGFFSDSDINIVAHELMQEIQDTLTVEILDNIRLCRLVSQEREP